MKKESKDFFKKVVSFLLVFLMIVLSVIYPYSKIKADGFPNDATGVSLDGKYYSVGPNNRLGMVTSDDLHTSAELFGFCMANSKKYPGYDADKDEYFGVYEQLLNLNKESFNKLVRDNHAPGNVATSHDELWNKVSKLIYIYLKDPTNVIGKSGWASPQAAINEFYTVVQNEIWRYTDGYKVDKDSNQYWFYKYSKQGQKAVYLLREAVDSINVPADFELRGYKPEKVKGKIGYQAIVTGRLKKDQPIAEIKTAITAGGITSTADEVATLKAKDVADGIEVSDKITYSGLYPNVKYDVIGEIYEVKDGELVNPDHPVSVVNSSVDLIPDATGKGEWTLNFGKLHLDAGKSYVAFTKIVSLEDVIDTDGDGKPDKKHEVVHNDPKDKAQTFTISPKEIVEKEVVFSKVNVAGEEIAGAQIQIRDAQGQVVHSWTSQEGQSETVKLKAGSYTFREVAAPNGYLAVTDITFEVDEQGMVTVKAANGNEVKAAGNKLTVTDQAAPALPTEKEVVFSKVNVAGEEIAGAQIQIRDAQGQVVHSWTSQEGQSQTVKLKAGSYTFREVAAPNGYLAVTDITFEVDEQGMVTVKAANGNEVKAAGNKLTVTDQAAPALPTEKEVVFSKVNVAGEEIAGAQIQIRDAQGQVVHSWTSQEGQSQTVKLKAGTYTFREVAAPNGYLAVTDITFEVDEQGTVTVKAANGNEVKAAGNKLTVTDQAAPALPTPEKSKTPSTPKQNLPKTGSEEKKSLYAELLLVLGSMLAIVGYKHRKNER